MRVCLSFAAFSCNIMLGGGGSELPLETLNGAYLLQCACTFEPLTLNICDHGHDVVRIPPK